MWPAFSLMHIGPKKSMGVTIWRKMSNWTKMVHCMSRFWRNSIVNTILYQFAAFKFHPRGQG